MKSRRSRIALPVVKVTSGGCAVMPLLTFCVHPWGEEHKAVTFEIRAGHWSYIKAQAEAACKLNADLMADEWRSWNQHVSKTDKP